MFAYHLPDATLSNLIVRAIKILASIALPIVTAFLEMCTLKM